MSEIWRGDLKPDLQVTISDAKAGATFATVTPSAVRVVVEQNGIVIVDGEPDTVTPAVDGSTAIIKRAWHAGETDEPGRMWISVVVDWAGTSPQTFPASGPLRLDVLRAAGDD